MDDDLTPYVLVFMLGVLVAAMVFVMLAPVPSEITSTGAVSVKYQLDGGDTQYTVVYAGGSFNATMDCSAYQVGQNVSFGIASGSDLNSILAPTYDNCPAS